MQNMNREDPVRFILFAHSVVPQCCWREINTNPRIFGWYCGYLANLHAVFDGSGDSLTSVVGLRRSLRDDVRRLLLHGLAEHELELARFVAA